MARILAVLLALVNVEYSHGQLGVGPMGAMGQMGLFGYPLCKMDPKCYFVKAGCTIEHRASPFYRMSPMSCEDCLAACQRSIANAGQSRHLCRSLVYDTRYKTCDLFDISGGPFKACNGQNYFQPTFMPGCGPVASTPAPVAKVCKENESPKLVAVKDYAVDGVTGKEAPGVDADACGKACLTGKLPDGTGIACKAAQFSNGKCTLSESAPPNEGQQHPSQGSTFFKLYCFPSDLVQGCPDVFTENPQKILVGQNKQTQDKATLDDCIKACLTAPKDAQFTCKSGMFYYNDNKLNCILNVESAQTKPDLFTDAAEGDVEVYFELNCGGGQKMAKQKKSFKDALKDVPEFGAWEMWWCHQNGNATRFQQCREKNSKHCPKQEAPCGATASVTSSAGNKKSGQDQMKRKKN